MECQVPNDFVKLMVKCWDEFADQRPSFKEVFKALRDLGPKYFLLTLSLYLYFISIYCITIIFQTIMHLSIK